MEKGPEASRKSITRVLDRQPSGSRAIDSPPHTSVHCKTLPPPPLGGFFEARQAHEAHLPAQHPEAEENPRVSRPDEDQRRPSRLKAPARQGPHAHRRLSALRAAFISVAEGGRRSAEQPGSRPSAQRRGLSKDPGEGSPSRRRAVRPRGRANPGGRVPPGACGFAAGWWGCRSEPGQATPAGGVPPLRERVGPGSRRRGPGQSRDQERDVRRGAR